MSNFWSAFFLMLIWIPLLTLWIFTFMDFFRRNDLVGWHVPLWIAFIIFIPVLGVMVYWITKPPSKSQSAVNEAYKRSREKAGNKGPGG